MGDSVGIPLIVVTRSDECATTINSVLRHAGHAVHCVRAADAPALEDALKARTPELVLCFTEESTCPPATVIESVGRCKPAPPVLFVQTKVDESAIAAAMEAGARDVVSLLNRRRFTAVVARELNAHRLQLALEGVLSSARQYKQELRNLVTGASEAIADVHDGIVVAANPAWLELFGVTREDELNGEPFMDLFRDADQAGLKGALVACLREKWQEDDPLPVVARRPDGTELPLNLHLKHVTVDGEPAVRVVVPAEKTPDQPPEELLQMAVTKDPSTGFLHRHHFLESLAERITQPRQGGIRAVAYLRPDHFARVQEDVGLLGTEALLMHFADILRELMLPGDLYGRFGGTMFTALVERGTIADVQAWAEQIRKAVANQVFEVESRSTSLTCTIGLCELRGCDQGPGEALGEAEQACRSGRDQGGNRVILSDLTSATEQVRALDALWVARLRSALMQNRLQLVHQPVVGLHEDVQGVFDTRVRLIDEQGEPVLASDFMPAARRAGMLKNIDRWVIGASFSFCAARRPELVFVRLSEDSLLDEPLLEWLSTRAGATRARPSQVCFQISEELALRHLKPARALAADLARRGFNFCVDHLGTGRDSVQLLDHLPMQYVKIDGSLMQGLHRDKDLQQKVGSIASRARDLKVKTIAERVENANTMAVLWQLGVTFVQGNFTQTHGLVLSESSEAERQAV